MAAIKRFEDLVVWQRAHALAVAVYEATRKAPFSRDFGLSDQIQRAAVSIASNIAEGHAYLNRTQFLRFLTIAHGSCAEVRAQLYIARDVGYLSQEEFASLRKQAEDVGRGLSALRLSIIRRAAESTKVPVVARPE